MLNEGKRRAEKGHIRDEVGQEKPLYPAVCRPDQLGLGDHYELQVPAARALD